MKALIELKPIRIPNFILQEKKPANCLSYDNVPKYAVEELDGQTISDLCDEFRENMFIKANKNDPKEKVTL